MSDMARALSDPSRPPLENRAQDTRVSEADKRFIAALDYSSAHSVEVTSEYIDDLTHEIREILEEQARVEKKATSYSPD